MDIFFRIYMAKDPVSYPLPLLHDTNCWMKCVQHKIYSVEQTPFFEKVIKLKIKVLQIPLFNKKERFAWWTVPIYNLGKTDKMLNINSGLRIITKIVLDFGE